MSSAEGDKSAFQKASDSVGGAKPGEKGYVEQAQEYAGSAAKVVQDTATGTLCHPSLSHFDRRE